MSTQSGATHSYQLASDAWSLVEHAYRQQQASGTTNEAIIDALSEGAHRAFDIALPIVPRSLPELRSYLAMLEKRGIAESPESVEAALATIGRAVAGLLTGPRS